MSLWAYISDFIRWLFVPSSNYFNNQIAALNVRVNAKLGGLSYLYQLINNFWKGLDNVSSADMNVTIPNNFFYPGYRGMSLDFLQSARPYLSMMSAVLTAAVCIFTAIVCYHKLRALFSEGGTAT